MTNDIPHQHSLTTTSPARDVGSPAQPVPPADTPQLDLGAPAAIPPSPAAHNREEVKVIGSGTAAPSSLSQADYKPSQTILYLAKGDSTLRDHRGVVRPEKMQRLTARDKEYLVGPRYSEDELFPDPQKLEGYQDYEYWWDDDHEWKLKGLAIAATSGGKWRDLLEAGLPLDQALQAILYQLISKGVRELPPHLRHALGCFPEAFRLVAEKAYLEVSGMDMAGATMWIDEDGWQISNADSEDEPPSDETDSDDEWAAFVACVERPSASPTITSAEESKPDLPSREE